MMSSSFVMLAVLVAGCGEQTPEPQTGGTGTGTRSPGSDTTDNAPPGSSSGHAATATSVIVRQTGGLAGVERTLTIVEDAAPPPGMSRSDVDRALRIAASPAFRSFPVTRRRALCCDHFTYSVSVIYSDGSSRTLTASDGRQHAAPLARLLRVVG